MKFKLHRFGLAAILTKYVWLATLVSLATTIATSQQSASSQVDDYVQKRMVEMKIPGLSLAVVKKGTIL